MKKKSFSKLVAVCALVVCILCSCGVKTGDAAYISGLQEYGEGNVTSALEKLERAKELGLERYGEDSLYNALGGCYLELDMYDESIEHYLIANELEPNNVEYMVNLAIAYRQSGDLGAAKDLYMKALKIDPNYAELNSSLGSLYILENNPEEAVIYFEKAIAANPGLAVAYGNAALAYAMLGDFDTADEYLELSVVKGYVNSEIMKERIDALRDNNR